MKNIMLVLLTLTALLSSCQKECVSPNNYSVYSVNPNYRVCTVDAIPPGGFDVTKTYEIEGTIYLLEVTWDEPKLWAHDPFVNECDTSAVSQKHREIWDETTNHMDRKIDTLRRNDFPAYLVYKKE